MLYWGGFLSKFRTALHDSSNYIPKYPEFENKQLFLTGITH